MKSFFVVLILVCTLNLFGASKTESKIYRIVFSGIYPDKETIKIWVDTEETLQSLKNVANVRIVSDPKEADLLVVATLRKDIDPKRVPVFVIGYKALKKYSTDALGGFYWQKGRPNIVFFKHRLLRFGIRLPQSFDDYIEESL